MLRIRATSWGYDGHGNRTRVQEDWLVNPAHIASICFWENVATVYIVGMIRSDGDSSPSQTLRVEDPPSIDRLAELERS